MQVVTVDDNYEASPSLTTWVSNLQSTIEDRRVLIDGKWLTANLLVIISYVYVLYDQRGRKLVRSGSAQKFGHEYNNS